MLKFDLSFIFSEIYKFVNTNCEYSEGSIHEEHVRHFKNFCVSTYTQIIENVR